MTGSKASTRSAPMCHKCYTCNAPVVINSFMREDAYYAPGPGPGSRPQLYWRYVLLCVVWRCSWWWRVCMRRVSWDWEGEEILCGLYWGQHVELGEHRTHQSVQTFSTLLRILHSVHIGPSRHSTLLDMHPYLYTFKHVDITKFKHFGTGTGVEGSRKLEVDIRLWCIRWQGRGGGGKWLARVGAWWGSHRRWKRFPNF